MSAKAIADSLTPAQFIGRCRERDVTLTLIDSADGQPSIRYASTTEKPVPRSVIDYLKINKPAVIDALLDDLTCLDDCSPSHYRALIVEAWTAAHDGEEPMQDKQGPLLLLLVAEARQLRSDLSDKDTEGADWLDTPRGAQICHQIEAIALWWHRHKHKQERQEPEQVSKLTSRACENCGERAAVHQGTLFYSGGRKRTVYTCAKCGPSVPCWYEESRCDEAWRIAWKRLRQEAPEADYSARNKA